MPKQYFSFGLLLTVLITAPGCEIGGGSSGGGGGGRFISLHYDHAPDRDDGQSAAADRTLLQSERGSVNNVIAVSGAYGRNGGSFNRGSDAVMNAVWGNNWIAAHGNRDGAIAAVTDRWVTALRGGSDVWVKEGGQSDLTAAVIARVKERLPNVNTQARIHVVQHGEWNESNTTPSALAYVRAESDYIRIANANSYLKGPRDEAFVQAAVNHPKFGSYWQAAFNYYPSIIDFSDTGELMHILGLGQIGINEFRERFLD